MIVITGANGFIGSALVWAFNQSGKNDIITVDIHNCPGKNLNKRCYEIYVNHEEFIKNAQFAKIEAIYHMGACTLTGETDWSYLKEMNLDYTQNLFIKCAEHNVRFFYASSSAVYGAGEQGYSDMLDSEKLRPLSLYGLSKVMMDRWAVKQLKVPPQWVGLRLFNVYGPNEYHNGDSVSLIYKAHLQIVKGEPLKLFKSHDPKYRDGEQSRDFVYIKEVTHWLLELLDRPEVNGILNMGFGQSRTWKDLAKIIFDIEGVDLNIEWIDMPLDIRKHYQSYTQSEMTKFSSLCLSSPQWPLERGIKDYILNHLEEEDMYL